MSKRRISVLNLDVRYRALTDAQFDQCKQAPGPYPLWGEQVSEQLEAEVARLVEETKNKPGRFRLTEDAARQKARVLLLEHAEEDALALQDYRRWNVEFCDAVLELGLISPQLDQLPAGVDAGKFIGEVFKAILDATLGDQGKEQGQPLPPTSQPAVPDETGPGVRAVQTK